MGPQTRIPKKRAKVLASSLYGGWLPAVLLLCALVTLPRVSRAEEPRPARIRDNLFILEEAYNQDPGVIQHISVFQYAPKVGEWTYSFTEECPVPTDLNQLSVTLNLQGGKSAGSTGFGDMLLNYRIQAVGLGGKGWLAVAPRLSIVVPTGDAKRGLGRGSIGVQFNVPVSMELGRRFVVHLNAGATLTPGAQAPAGRTATALDVNAGVAWVWQPLTWLNPLVEVSYTMTTGVGDRSVERVHALVVSPGLRVAIDHPPSGLQVVPGVAAPMRVVPTGDVEVGALAYLCFEHPAF